MSHMLMCQKVKGVLTILTGKNCVLLNSVQECCLAASDIFHMLTHSIKLLHIPLSRIRERRCLKKVIHQIDIKKEWLFLSACFAAKFGLVFVLTLEDAFS